MSNEAARQICSQSVTSAIMFTALRVGSAPCEGTKFPVSGMVVNFDNLTNYFVAAMAVWKNLTCKNLDP